MTHAIVTADTFEAEKHRLLELNEDVEKEILNGGKLVLVGSNAQKAVLCSQDKTYFVVKEDTSNLRLLTHFHDWATKDTDKENVSSSDAIPIQIESSATSHFLLVPKKPDPFVLQQLLMEAPFGKAETGPDAKRRRLDPSTIKKPTLYTTQDLVLQLQISETELQRLLKQLHAFELDGHWRLLAPDLQRQVFGEMLDAVVENDWDLLSATGLKISDFVSQLESQEIQEQVIHQCCRIYGDFVDADETHVRLDETKVALFYAEQLFREAPGASSLTANAAVKGKLTATIRLKGEESKQVARIREWPRDVFMEKWQLRVPERIVVSAEMLQGLAFERQEPNKSKPMLVFLPERELPTEPAARFETLFQLQEKWSLPQLKPYIQSLVGNGVTQAALLLKHTRTSRMKGISDKLYSRR